MDGDQQFDGGSIEATREATMEASRGSHSIAAYWLPSYVAREAKTLLVIGRLIW